MLGSSVMFIFIKLFVRDFSPVLLALAMRPLVAAMVSSCALCIKKRPKVQDLKTGALLTLSGIADRSALLCHNLGVRSENVSLVGQILLCAPIVAIVLAGIFFNERITRIQKVGLMSVFAGLVAFGTV